jgi:hypothetical protein
MSDTDISIPPTGPRDAMALEYDIREPTGASDAEVPLHAMLAYTRPRIA